MDYVSYEEASRLLERALSDEPQQKNVRLYLAFAYFKLDKQKEAIRLLEEEQALFPDSFNALILKGYMCFDQGKYEEAAGACYDFKAVIENAAKVLARKKGRDLYNDVHPVLRSQYDYFVNQVRGDNPNFCLPYFILGLQYKKSGRFSSAEDSFRRALDWGYDRVQCFTQLIDIDLVKEDWQGALIRSEKALDSEGPHSNFYQLKGFAYDQLGETEHAAMCFQDAIKLKPYSEECMKNLAKIFISQNEFDKAAPLLEKALRLSPFDRDVYSLRMDVSETRPKTQQKRRRRLSKVFVDDLTLDYKYDFVTDINDVVYGINAAALALIRTGKLHVAGNLILRFLEIHDLSPELNYNLAHLYKLNKSYGNALRHAWRATELKEDFKDAYDLLAGVYFEIQDFLSAIRFYEKVIEFDPNDSMSSYNLGCAYFAVKDCEKAEKQWKAAIESEKSEKGQRKDKTSRDVLDVNITVEVFPISFEAHKSLGHLYLQKNDKGKALEAFTQASELEPRNPEPYYEIGKIYFELEDLKNAAFYFDKYRSLGGKEEKIKDVIKDECQTANAFPF